MILVIDNYDSFTWNLVDLLHRGPFPVEVVRNDELSLEGLVDKKPLGIMISPGPGRPADSGLSLRITQSMYRKVPILGICLGHQLLGELFGMEVVHAPEPIHGKTSLLEHDGQGLFRNLPSPMQVMRYHSLLLNPDTIPHELEVSAATAEGHIMGIRHKSYKIAGVQFHPESIQTPEGNQLITNWLEDLEALAPKVPTQDKVD